MPAALNSTFASGYRQTKQVVGLDVIRCLAAIIVMAFHLNYWFWAGGDAHRGYGGEMADYSGGPLVYFGWVGVEVFFVLSGFVIAYSASSASAPAFLRSRILRLVPAAWICSTITLAVVLLVGAGPNTSALHAVREWVYTLAFHPFGPWVDWSYWTLGVEISFYAVVLALLARGGFAFMPLVVGAIGVISSAYWLAYMVPALRPLVDTSSDTISRLRQLALVDHGCFFAIGAFLWLGLFQAFTMRRVTVLAACVAGGLLEIIARTEIVGTIAHVPYSAVVPCLVWLGSIGLLCASVLGNAVLLARFGRFAPFVRGLGLMTYPLYLLHQMIGFTLIGAAHGSAPDLLVVSVVEIITVALACLVSVYLEPALRRLLSQAMPGRQPARRQYPVSLN